MRGVFDSCFTASSCYLIVGKDGKKALLKEDGSIVGNTWYDDIFSATEYFAAVKEGDKVFVRNLDDPSKEYPINSSTYLEETENSLKLISGAHVTELLDKNFIKIDLSKYSQVDNLYSYIPYSDYLQISADNGRHGILSDTGKEIVPAKYTAVSIFTYKGGYYFYAENDDPSSNPIDFTVYKDDGTVFIGKTSGSMIADDLDSSEGCAVYYKDNGYGIYDFNTRSVKVEPAYESIKAYDSRCFAYTTDGKLGVKSYDNKDILACGQYLKVPYVSISDGRIVVNAQDEQGVFTSYVYASDTGKMIFSYQSDKQGYCLLGYNNGVAEYVSYYYFLPFGVFDKNGKEVISPFSYGYIAECCTIKGQTLFAGHNGKIGIIDSQGQPLTDFKYDNLGNSHGESFWVSDDFGNENQKFFLTVESNKYGLIEISSTVQPSLSLDKTAVSPPTGSSPLGTAAALPMIAVSAVAVYVTRKKEA